MNGPAPGTGPGQTTGHDVNHAVESGALGDGVGRWGGHGRGVTAGRMGAGHKGLLADRRQQVVIGFKPFLTRPLPVEDDAVLFPGGPHMGGM